MSTISFKQLADNLFVSPQICVTDIEKIAEAGIKTVVCHRPDEELIAQFSEAEPDYQTVEELLSDKGITCVYQPIRQIAMPAVQAFSDTLSTADTPVLAYCTSGTRSTLLWALGQTMIDGQSRETVIEKAEKAGYEIGRYLS